MRSKCNNNCNQPQTLKPHIDFGFVPTVSLGSVIWNDKNDNGIQDSDEVGIDGLKVTLLDGDGNPVSGVDPVITDSSGRYYFDELLQGDYKIKIESNTTSLADYQPSSVQSSDPNDDNATDSNIESGDSTNGYVSGLITLTVNGEPSGSDDG